MNSILCNDIDISWMPFLYRTDIKSILDNVSNKYIEKVTSPNKQDILRFMKQDLVSAKYVLYGQDPYPITDNNMVATGRCFEPSNYNDWTEKSPNASIRNILRAIYGFDNNIKNPSIKEIRNDIKNNSFVISNPSEFFDNLEKQGIILLNYGLTVGKNPMSNIDDWHVFQRKLIQYMYQRNPQLKYILWGNTVFNLFKDASRFDNDTLERITIVDSHPSTNKFVTHNKTLKLTPDINWH